MKSKRIIKRRIARRHEPERKLIERIRVYLRKKGWRLREHKGRYVIVDLLRGDAIVEDHVDLKQFARKAGLLKP
jgi:predicted transcriptional regulator of viral defense system